ncbi:MAG: hypothetical protein LBT84_07750 [Spirochaetia bacterium]|jgi:hypothetical protein|nr:hypothetical protein [Spirochaetia bacterium]
MNKKIKTLILFLLIVFVINSIVSACLFYANGFDVTFRGYAMGSVFAALFGLSWVFQTRRVINAAPLAIFKSVALGFAVKSAALCALFIAWRKASFFDVVYFGAAFILGLAGSSLAEIWLYISLLKERKREA